MARAPGLQGAHRREQDLDGGPDPFLREQVEQAVAPYAGVLPPEALEELREVLEVVLYAHPAVAPVVERLRRRRPPAESGGRLKGQGGEGEP